jgi:hypothetical protein
MTLTGKGFFTWRIENCEGGNVQAIVAKALAANLSHLCLKIADEVFPFGVDRNNNDRMPPLVKELQQRGIKVWGWHYVYGRNPQGEAEMAIKRCQQLKLDGYVIDAEAEYKEAGKAAAATTFMNVLRQGLPTLPVALSSYRYPSYHQQFPWQQFLEKCDLNMPQVYWEQAHNPDAQLVRTVQEFNNPALVGFVRPIIPTGSTYGTNGWEATPDEVRKFFQKAKDLGLSGANAYSWDWATSKDKTALWDSVANFDWPTELAPAGSLGGTASPSGSSSGGITVIPGGDLISRYFDALNRFDVEQLMQFYQPNAVHVTGARTLVGQDAIKQFYLDLLGAKIPYPRFHTVSVTNQEPTCQVTWTAENAKQKIEDGSDTLGLRDGLIQYHYSKFTIQ